VSQFFLKAIMKTVHTACLYIFFACLAAWSHPAIPQTPAGLVDQLADTRALNIETIIAGQFANAEPARGFSVADPYHPQAADIVRKWHSGNGFKDEVCALRFIDDSGYELRGFNSSATAQAAGFIVTHQGRCGTCSTLQDLAAYLATPDLTTPARQCARRLGLAGKKKCYEEKTGFTPYCAESWAYNARHTKKACLGTCISDYGLLNLLFHRYEGENITQPGKLRPCLQCDEDKSGPGFKYSAGRTRRNSGVESAIPRPEQDVYPVDHSAYFNH
jgi:hypothetical protein